MSIEQALALIPSYVLVFFRITGMMVFAPLFGSARIPGRVKVLFAAILAIGFLGAVPADVKLPQTTWALAVGIGGELAFGIAMGMALAFAFIAAQWAGEMIGQQMGLNMSEVLDPQFGAQSSLIGDLYFMLTLVVFLLVRGHHAMLRGVHASFQSLPLLSVGIDQNMMDVLVNMLSACTMLALQLAAPMLVTMLIVDLALGFVGKTMPQINVMSAGLSMRSALGMVVVITGLMLTSQIMRSALIDAMQAVASGWSKGG
jgi:flagellar biosynthetic protein FliR